MHGRRNPSSDDAVKKNDPEEIAVLLSGDAFDKIWKYYVKNV